MYSVKELIEALLKCPEDYEVVINTPEGGFGIEAVGIDHEDKTVDLFADL